MARALELAQRAWGETHPNPMVGAVIAESGAIVAEGWHRRAGEAHAEVAALENLGRAPAMDATLYVTLEPCSTEGRTPPCTHAILRAGLRRVCIGALDPNPLHAGRAVGVLREGGVEVTVGLLSGEAEDLNLLFNRFIPEGRPVFAAKVATTLDGKIATRAGISKWITGETARANAGRWRKLFPGIAVGAGTVLADDPALTARGPWGESVPHRFVFDRELVTLNQPDLPRLYAAGAGPAVTLICEPDADGVLKRRALESGLELLEIAEPGEPEGFDAFRRHCAGRGLTGVLFEGGARLLSALLQAQALDYLFWYRAPRLLADDAALSPFKDRETPSLDTGIKLKDVHHAVLGGDQLMRGQVVYPEEEG